MKSEGQEITDLLDSQDQQTALFAHLVMQQANMAMMLLGQVPHPESGEVVKDLQTAKLFIDQLEMLEAKTKGNLTKEEASLLQQSLVNLRLAFVEAVEAEPSSTAAPSPAPSSASPSAKPAAPAAPAEEDEHRKKFSKKY